MEFAQIYAIGATVVYYTIITGLFLWSAGVIQSEFGNSLKLLRKIFVYWPQAWRDQRFLRQVKRIGQIAVYNSHSGIVAISPLQDFEGEMRIATSILRPEQLVKPLRVMPNNTFAFAEEDSGILAVIGTEIDLLDIIELVILEKTHFSRKQISASAMKTARSIMVKRDKRLLVPFVREGHLPNGTLMRSIEEQVSLYGKYTIQDVYSSLLIG